MLSKELGKLIWDIREYFNMSRRCLARESGLSYRTIFNVEHGLHKPHLRTLDLLILTFRIERLKELKAEQGD